MSSTRTPVVFRRLAICLALTVALAVPTIGAASAEVGRASSSCKKTPGEPIPIYQIAQLAGPTSQTNYRLAVEAATKSVNCAGGVDGQPLKLTSCNGNSLVDPNLGQNCVRDAIADGAVAAPGLQTLDNPVVQALNDAGIPSLGTPTVVQSLVAPTAFNPTGGIVATLAVLAAKLWDKGARKIRVVSLDAPMAAALINLGNEGLESRGGKMLDPVLFPTDPSADDSAQVQAAINGADAIIVLQTLEGTQKIVPELYAAGFKGMLGINASTIPPDEPVLQGHKGIVFVQGFLPTTATDSQAIRQFNADMKKYAPKLGRTVTDADVISWVSVKIVADALEQATTKDAAGLVSVLNTYKVPFDLGPTIDFSQGGKFGVPRLFTTEAVPLKLKSKKYYQDGPVLDATAPPPASTTTTKAK